MTTTDAANFVNEAFGDGRLLRPTAAALEASGLPKAAREFLLAGGLPAGRVFAFDFGLVRELPSVEAYAARHGYAAPSPPAGNAICLGDSWGGVLITVRPGTGDVVVIDLKGEQEDAFVNSDVACLGASLAAYASLAPHREHETGAASAARLAQALLRIDPPCLAGWWSSVVEELEWGLS